MTFIIQGTEYEGEKLTKLFPDTREYQIKYAHSQLKKWLTEGNKIYVKLTEGARKGTIGELVLAPEEMDELYKEVRNYRGTADTIQRHVWHIKFDDSDKTVKLEGTNYWRTPGFLSFVPQATAWVYTTKERPKVELPVLHDHFGVQLEVGQVCLALVGKGTSQYVRLGKITRWSEKATIWIETMKTREKHPANKEETVQGSINIFVLDGDIRSKAMMAKLKFS